MVDSIGPKPEIINLGVNEALARAKGNPGPSSVWDVVRQLGQGELTVANTVSEAPSSAFDPTALPGDLAPQQSILALNSDKGPLLVAFTEKNISSLLPPGIPQAVDEKQYPALQVASIAGKEPYAGLAIDPGSENGYVIPRPFLNAGLPGGQTNFQVKTMLANPQFTQASADSGARQALIQAVATGPIYTPVEKAAFEATGEFKFPLVPLGGAALNGQTPAPDADAAVIFGTSPAEIAAVFNPDQWVPMQVRLNDVIATLRKSSNVKLVVINPHGPTLQLPVTPQAPSDEPTPEPGPSTEPDGGTREGED